MRIPQEIEVIVIGGGAMGTSIAYHLKPEYEQIYAKVKKEFRKAGIPV